MKVAPENEGNDARPNTSEIPLASQKLPEQVVMVSCQEDVCLPQAPEPMGATEANGSTKLEQLQGIKLRGPYPSQNMVSSSLLWAQRPAVIMIVRRMGCAICRHSFKKMIQLKFEFDKIGVDLVAISNQDLYAEDFVQDAWGGLPLYIDEEDRFREAMGAPVYKGLWLCKPAVIKKVCTVSASGGPKDINKKANRVGGDLVIANHGIFFERNEDSTFSHTEPSVLLKAARKARGFAE